MPLAKSDFYPRDLLACRTTGDGLRFSSAVAIAPTSPTCGSGAWRPLPRNAGTPRSAGRSPEPVAAIFHIQQRVSVHLRARLRARQCWPHDPSGLPPPSPTPDARSPVPRPSQSPAATHVEALVQSVREQKSPIRRTTSPLGGISKDVWRRVRTSLIPEGSCDQRAPA